MTTSTTGTGQTRAPIARVLLELVRNQRGPYAVSLTVWVLIWTMPVLTGLLAAGFFDTLTGQATGWNLTTLLVALWAWCVARGVAVLLGMRLHGGILFRAGAAMQRNMLGWIHSLPGARPVLGSAGEVVSRFRDDVEHTTEALDYTVDLAGSIVSATVAAVVLFALEPRIALVVLVPVTVVVLATARLGERIRRYRTAARDTTEGITGFLGEAFGAVQSVKVAGAEAPMLARLDVLNDRRRHMMVRDRVLTAALEAVFHNTVSIGTGLIMVLAAGALASPSSGLTVGRFALFVYLLGMVTDAAWFTGVFLARLKQAGVSVERMVALMDGADWRELSAPHDLERVTVAASDRQLGRPSVQRLDTADHDAQRPGVPLLSVRGLAHTFEGGRGMVDVDLDVHRGELVVVTGRIGAGKTTLLRTILGLLPADAGEIRWQGELVADPATFMVPPRAAYTPQVPRLFSMSLRDNLLLGHDATAEELEAAVRAATLERDLAAMPDGFDTLVGTRGLRLSGGQVQRSAAARMLVRTPALLVFDDLSSALDVETEAALWDQLLDRGDTTALVVSHRRPALLRADRVLVMQDGRVVASGPAPQLLATSATFRELWG